MSGAAEDLARRIESQAAISTRPGQLAELEQIAREVRALNVERLRSALTAAADRLYRLAETRAFTEVHRGDHVGDELRARRKYAVEGEAQARSALYEPLEAL